MSKGSARRPSMVSDDQLEANWSLVFGNKDSGYGTDLTVIYVWPDGYWCEAEDLELQNDRSDDYTAVYLTEREYLCLVGDTQGLL